MDEADLCKSKTYNRLVHIFGNREEVEKILGDIYGEHPGATQASRTLNSQYPDADVSATSFLTCMRLLGLSINPPLNPRSSPRKMWYPSLAQIIDASKKVKSTGERLETALKLPAGSLPKVLAKRRITLYHGGIYRSDDAGNRYGKVEI